MVWPVRPSPCSHCKDVRGKLVKGRECALPAGAHGMPSHHHASGNTAIWVQGYACLPLRPACAPTAHLPAALRSPTCPPALCLATTATLSRLLPHWLLLLLTWSGRLRASPTAPPAKAPSPMSTTPPWVRWERTKSWLLKGCHGRLRQFDQPPCTACRLRCLPAACQPCLQALPAGSCLLSACALPEWGSYLNGTQPPNLSLPSRRPSLPVHRHLEQRHHHDCLWPPARHRQARQGLPGGRAGGGGWRRQD